MSHVELLHLPPHLPPPQDLNAADLKPAASTSQTAVNLDDGGSGSIKLVSLGSSLSSSSHSLAARSVEHGNCPEDKIFNGAYGGACGNAKKNKITSSEPWTSIVAAEYHTTPLADTHMEHLGQCGGQNPNQIVTPKSTRTEMPHAASNKDSPPSPAVFSSARGPIVTSLPKSSLSSRPLPVTLSTVGGKPINHCLFFGQFSGSPAEYLNELKSQNLAIDECRKTIGHGGIGPKFDTSNAATVILEKEIECLRDELRKTTKKNYRIVSQILPLQKLVKSKRDALEKIKNALHKNGQKLNNLLAVIAHCNSEAKEIACKRISSADEDDDSFDTASSDSSSCDHNYHSYDELANEINQLNTSIEEFEIENDMFSGEIDTMQKQIDGINVYFTEVDRIVHTPDMLVKEKIKVLTQMAEATILFVSKLERT